MLVPSPLLSRDEGGEVLLRRLVLSPDGVPSSDLAKCRESTALPSDRLRGGEGVRVAACLREAVLCCWAPRVRLDIQNGKYSVLFDESLFLLSLRKKELRLLFGAQKGTSATFWVVRFCWHCAKRNFGYFLLSAISDFCA